MEIFEKELKDEKRTIHFADRKLMFNGHDITGILKPMMEAAKAHDHEKVGWILAATLTKEDGEPQPDPKEKALWDAAKFAQGFLKGAKVGVFDVKALHDCLEHEPITDKMLEIAGKEMFESMKYKKPELGVKALVTVTEAMAKMVLETAPKKEGEYPNHHGHHEHPKPICADLFFKEKHDWKAAAIFEKEVFDEHTSIHYAPNGHMYFNHHDISWVEKPLAESLMKKDLGKAGWLLAASLVKAEGESHHGHHGHHGW